MGKTIVGGVENEDVDREVVDSVGRDVDGLQFAFGVARIVHFAEVVACDAEGEASAVRARGLDYLQRRHVGPVFVVEEISQSVAAEYVVVRLGGGEDVVTEAILLVGVDNVVLGL